MAQLKDYATARAIAVLWNKYQASLGEPPYLGRSKFGVSKQDNLDLAFIKGKSSLPVSLKASAFDAQAELRDGIGFSRVENSMPFFRESIMFTEKEEQMYADFNASMVDKGAELLRQVVKKPLDLIRGARVVPERMIWQLLAPTDGIPKITTYVNGEVNTYYYMTSAEETAFKATNFVEIKGDSQWKNANSATPLADLIKIKKDFAKNTGYNLVRFSMNIETWEELVSAEDTKKQVLGILAYQNGIRMADEDVVRYLAGKGIEIEVYNKIYVDENGTSQYFIPTGYVSAQSAGVYLGEFVFGRTPEERSGDATTGSLSLVDTGIAVYTYSTNHPINTHCVVSEIGLPTYEGMDSVVCINVDAGESPSA